VLLGTNVDNYDVKPQDTEPESIGLQATLTIKVVDKNGNVKSKFTVKSHSPTYNFIALLEYIVGKTVTITAIDGTQINTHGLYQFFACSVAIAVGSGTSSSPFNQTNLVATIPNGNGAGQLVYGSTNVSNSITGSGNALSFEIYNVFTNASNTTVSVSELGLIVNVQFVLNDTYEPYNVLVWYDTIPTINLAPGDALTVTYTFTINP